MIDSKTYATTEQLRNGRTVRIRTISPDDKPVLTEGMHHLSTQSLYFRFFTPKEELTAGELAYFTELDFSHHVGLVASIVEQGSERPAGVGRYVKPSTEAPARTAELAFAITEEYQGQGIATLLLKHLTQIARAEGITEFTAFVLPENRAMLRVFHKSGLPIKRVLNSAGVFEITLSLN